MLSWYLLNELHGMCDKNYIFWNLLIISLSILFIRSIEIILFLGAFMRLLTLAGILFLSLSLSGCGFFHHHGGGHQGGNNGHHSNRH